MPRGTAPLQNKPLLEASSAAPAPGAARFGCALPALPTQLSGVQLSVLINKQVSLFCFCCLFAGSSAGCLDFPGDLWRVAAYC